MENTSVVFIFSEAFLADMRLKQARNQSRIAGGSGSHEAKKRGMRNFIQEASLSTASLGMPGVMSIFRGAAVGGEEVFG